MKGSPYKNSRTLSNAIISRADRDKESLHTMAFLMFHMIIISHCLHESLGVSEWGVNLT